MLRYLLLAVFIPALILATPTRECTGGRVHPVEVRVTACDAAPCDVFQGAYAEMQVDFIAHNGANGLRPVVFATALGATIEYHLQPQFHNACNHLVAGACPLAPMAAATYHFEFGVTTFYPPIPVAVELSLVDENDNHVFCSIIDIHVRIP